MAHQSHAYTYIMSQAVHAPICSTFLDEGSQPGEDPVPIQHSKACGQASHDWELLHFLCVAALSGCNVKWGKLGGNLQIGDMIN